MLGSKAARNFSARNGILIEDDRIELLEQLKFLLVNNPNLTRPGAKRVRLWRDRGGPGGVPRTRVKRLLPFVPQGSKNLL